MTTYQGFIRPNGRVGIRNHVVAIANCSCANGLINRIAAAVPEVVPLLHTYGCSIPGEFERWHKILTGVCSNPNIYGVILVGVGCETYDAKEMGKEIHGLSGMPVFAQIVQEDGGCEAVIEACVRQAKLMLRGASECRREEAPISTLVFGTQCGGSDALSGITSNPAIGYVSDWVVSEGGTVLLTEMAEMIGTADILAARAVNEEVAGKIRKAIEDEEIEVRKWMGPEASRIIARGNMEGGLTTVQEKALGCIKKGGTTPIVDVLEYGEPIGDRKGLVIMRGPGYDPVSLTGLFSTGAQVFFFSTGRGNPLGYPVAPCVKVCSNSRTYEAVGGNHEGDMDINAGAVVTEGLSPAELGEQCVRYLLEVLNGKMTVPERHGLGGALCVFQSSTPL